MSITKDRARTKPQTMTEQSFTTAVLQWAKVYGWRRFHVRNSGRMHNGYAIPTVQGDRGFPDLVLVRPPRLIFAELKVGKNRVHDGDAQSIWLSDLAMSTAECYTWSPAQWSELLVVLSR